MNKYLLCKKNGFSYLTLVNNVKLTLSIQFVSISSCSVFIKAFRPTAVDHMLPRGYFIFVPEVSRIKLGTSYV